MVRDNETPDPDALGSEESAHSDEGPAPSQSRVLRFARRLMDRRDLAEDSKELLSAFLASSDKVKSEAMRLLAREVRLYLKELRLKEDVMDLIRSHSLKISIHLEPLATTDQSKKPTDPE